MIHLFWKEKGEEEKPHLFVCHQFLSHCYSLQVSSILTYCNDFKIWFFGYLTKLFLYGNIGGYSLIVLK